MTERKIKAKDEQWQGIALLHASQRAQDEAMRHGKKAFEVLGGQPHEVITNFNIETGEVTFTTKEEPAAPAED